MLWNLLIIMGISIADTWQRLLKIFSLISVINFDSLLARLGSVVITRV